MGSIVKSLSRSSRQHYMFVWALILLLVAYQLLCFTSYLPVAKYLHGPSNAQTKEEDHLHYPCFPPRDMMALNSQNQTAITTVYIQTVWGDMHSETFYSFIHELCSCSTTKYSQWTIPFGSMPHFYIGPHELPDLHGVYQELNQTNCGPIFFGTPLNPDLTIITTAYAHDFENYYPWEMRNDTRKIIICHHDIPKLEGDNATSVFWLTPHHSRYIIPTFFPPTIVERAKTSLLDHPNKIPVFLVMGSFNSEKRNINSLKTVLEAYSNRSFAVHLLGGASGHSKIEDLERFVNESFTKYSAKIQLLPNLDNPGFMAAVGQVDVILPLVDETNFYGTYEGGKKLTSAVSWALGFQKKMVIFKPLAEVFHIPDNKEMFWHYENSTTFSDAFGECLNKLDLHIRSG